MNKSPFPMFFKRPEAIRFEGVDGLVMSFTIETGGAASNDTEKMIIEKIAVNPTHGAGRFSEPTSPGNHRRGVLADTTIGG